MISHLADPRDPHDVARKIVARGERLGDSEMVRRGQRLLKLAHDMDERRASEMRLVEAAARQDVRPSDRDVLIHHNVAEPGGHMAEAAYTWGQCIGLVLISFYIGVVVFGLWHTALFTAGTALVVGTGWALVATIRRSRE